MILCVQMLTHRGKEQSKSVTLYLDAEVEWSVVKPKAV